jgi:hypothetical protein
MKSNNFYRKRSCCLAVLLFLISSNANAITNITQYSDVHKEGYQYVSPWPNSIYSPRESMIIIRFEGALPSDLINLKFFIEAQGILSGLHSGEVKIASDKKTIIFKPSSRFWAGEKVNLVINPVFKMGVKANVKPIMYSFYISSETTLPSLNLMSEDSTSLMYDEQVLMTSPEQAQIQADVGPVILENGVSVPSDFPYVYFTVNNVDPNEGYIFINYRNSPRYSLILDSQGLPVWYLRTSDMRRDFKVQKNGTLSMMGSNGVNMSDWHFIGMDPNYVANKTYYAKNGYVADEHDIQVLEDGSYLMVAIKEDRVDMTKFVSGGYTNAIVRESCIQEFTPEGDLIFQWRAWDNYDIRDVHVDSPSSNNIRFSHMNAIEIDKDGNILLSNRHISEVTKIDRHTGDIIWRLGGAHNQFTFIKDPLNGFSAQHDIRSMGNGHYTLFDNGNNRYPQVSRAVEYIIDPNKMTATFFWEYREGTYTYYMGNAQRLPNGNTVIGWGDQPLPRLTEVDPNGVKLCEMNFVTPAACYRVFKSPWNGVADVPYLVAEPQDNCITLIFNKFGDKNVDYYRIYGGTSLNPTTVLDETKSTMTSLSIFQNNGLHYFRVTAVDVNGIESGFSNEASASVNFYSPEMNMLSNGIFRKDIEPWIWKTPVSPADANWVIDSGQFHFIINSPGDLISSVQLKQNGLRIYQGKTYVLEFDAQADAPRYIQAEIMQDVSPWTNYSKMGYCYITTQMQHFKKEFVMNSPSDFNGSVVFNTGNSDIDVYIDNVSIKYLSED